MGCQFNSLTIFPGRKSFAVIFNFEFKSLQLRT